MANQAPPSSSAMPTAIPMTGGTTRGGSKWRRRSIAAPSQPSQSKIVMATETWGTGMGHGASVLGIAAPQRDGTREQRHKRSGHKPQLLSSATARQSPLNMNSPRQDDSASYPPFHPREGVDPFHPGSSNDYTTAHDNASVPSLDQAHRSFDVEQHAAREEDISTRERIKANMGKYSKATSNSNLRRRLQHRSSQIRQSLGGPGSATMGSAHDDAQAGSDCFSSIRYRWDAVKTATPGRRFALACLAEFFGAWIYSFVLWGTVYNMLASTFAAIETSLLCLYYFLGTFAGVYFTLLIASPIAGGHFVPHITIVSTLVGLFPIWKAPIYIIFQCLGFWVGQLMAVRTVWHWISEVRDFLLEESAGDASVFFKHSSIARTPLAGFFIYFKPSLKPWSTVVFTEVVLNFLIGLVICGSFDISNPYVSPSNSIFPIALAAGALFGFFAPPSQSLDPARWMSGFTCWMIFDDRQRCFPAKETLFVLLAPILGLLLAYIWYAAFISDSRRPAASQMLSDVDDIVRQRAQQAREKQAEWISKRAEKKEADLEFKLLNRPLLPSDTVDVIQTSRTSEHQQHERHHMSPVSVIGHDAGSPTRGGHVRGLSSSSGPGQDVRQMVNDSLSHADGDPLTPPPQIYSPPGHAPKDN